LGDHKQWSEILLGCKRQGGGVKGKHPRGHGKRKLPGDDATRERKHVEKTTRAPVP